MKGESKTLLVEIAELSPKALLILDFFMDSPSFDYSETYVAQTLKISRMTMNRLWRGLEEGKIIIFSRKMGRAKLYRLNLQNPFVQMLMKLEYLLNTKMFEVEKQTVAVPQKH